MCISRMPRWWGTSQFYFCKAIVHLNFSQTTLVTTVAITQQPEKYVRTYLCIYQVICLASVTRETLLTLSWVVSTIYLRRYVVFTFVAITCVQTSLVEFGNTHSAARMGSFAETRKLLRRWHSQLTVSCGPRFHALSPEPTKYVHLRLTRPN